MKKEKLNISKLKVKSFTTNKADIKGGYASAPNQCPTGLGAYVCSNIEPC
ncbi:hypothetical protein AB9P05_14200 [Roseivirga sp. BDSF3-8]